MNQEYLNKLSSYDGFYKSIDNGENIYVNGIVPEATGHFLYSLYRNKKRPVFVVCENDKKARKLYEQLSELLEDKLHLFPELDLNFQSATNYDYENRSHRLKAMKALIKGESSIILTYPQALMNRLEKASEFAKKSMIISMDTELDPMEFSAYLSQHGYTKTQTVEAKGEFSIRGDIIDVFEIHEDNPIRIELFDTEIDSLRRFDVNTQLSIDKVDEIEIYPVFSIEFDDHDLKKITDSILEDLEIVKKIYGQEVYSHACDKFLSLIDDLHPIKASENADLFIPYSQKDFVGISDYLNKDSITVMLDYPRIIESHKEIETFIFEQYKYGVESGYLLPKHINSFVKQSEIFEELSKRQYVNISQVYKKFKTLDFDLRLEIRTREVEQYHGRWQDFIDSVESFMKDKYKIYILANNKDKIASLKKEFELLEYPVYGEMPNSDKSYGIQIIGSNWTNGFEYIDDKVVFITEYEIFGSAKSKSKKSTKIINKRDFLNYTDLEVGDLVVHENYGVGKYLGLKNIEVQDSKVDYIEIEYRSGDKLFIPTTEMGLISKYVGAGEALPKLSKLYSSDWTKTTQKAKKAIEQIAENLVRLYANRSKIKGFKFSKDTPWQQEFEDQFMFEETNAQLRAVDEIKSDMELDLPMDRLLCGDVGYGKTEVAFRAAFKAIMDGKQVVMLAPTTILVKQHFTNMVKRFKEFPLDIDYISRFKTPKQKEEIKKKLRKGQLDFVVGTHALLADSVTFKNLGLLIIDEEQRFGVKHKEKIKEITQDIDVLTLSATPIPRTLQMSLSGIREMSLLDEAPENRLPINTYVMEYEPAVIRTAILKELARGGQIYFVFNRVNGIETMKKHLQELVPEASIAVTHGQMSNANLDKILDSFVKNEIDILLTTTIIETGMDIQNVNTIIVYNADMMGLSQLYQLKGRIGRSDRSAFAYFTFEKYKSITEIAEKRLKAIKDFNELGAGYKIAMRDLELRGAGNLLGESQSGHIESIGYDLYVRMLKESIDSLKGIEPKKKSNVKIDVKVDAYIPGSYIPDHTEKINMYKKISYIENIEDYHDIVDELIDRFGTFPKAVQNILDLSLIRTMLERVSFDEMVEVDGEIEFRYDNFNVFSVKKLERLSKLYEGYMRFDLVSTKKIIIKKDMSFIENSKKLLEQIYEMIGENDEEN
ncbi:MAG: transcription-repair coupling factor [Tissierellia bacterium]|nr:transcription-repair coupling factor [Tissierellia bacterium]